MNQTTLRYLASFAAGVLLTALVFLAAGTHYRLHTKGDELLRINTWTGSTWFRGTRYVPLTAAEITAVEKRQRETATPRPVDEHYVPFAHLLEDTQNDINNKQALQGSTITTWLPIHNP
jgi:hypothetical protein